MQKQYFSVKNRSRRAHSAAHVPHKMFSGMTSLVECYTAEWTEGYDRVFSQSPQTSHDRMSGGNLNPGPAIYGIGIVQNRRFNKSCREKKACEK